MTIENIKTCARCKRMFPSITGRNICPECNDELEKALAKAKEYLWKNKTTSIQQLAQEVNVTPAIVKTWIKEERISFKISDGTEIRCESCGTIIDTGRFCPNCKFKMLDSIKKTVSPAPKSEPVVERRPTKSKMRYVGSITDK